MQFDFHVALFLRAMGVSVSIAQHLQLLSIMSCLAVEEAHMPGRTWSPHVTNAITKRQIGRSKRLVGDCAMFLANQWVQRGESWEPVGPMNDGSPTYSRMV